MHHEPCFALLERTYLAKLVGVIFHDYGELARLSVSAYGCSLHDDDEPQDRQHSLQSRMLVEGILNFYFDRRQLNIEWTPLNAVGELFLDVQTGKFKKEFDLLHDLFI